MVVLHVKSLAYKFEEKKKTCEVEPSLTRYLDYLGGHGDFLRLIFVRAIEKFYSFGYM